jgi:hypothetical protein
LTQTAREPESRFFESLPQPWGEAAAVDALATTAAPMLAGFSFALLGLVITGSSSLHWPSLTVALLVAAGLILSVAVQFGSIARRWAISPADWRELLSVAPETQLRALANAGPAALAKHRRWLLWTRIIFNCGLVVLFVAVAFALVPANPHNALTGGRIVGIAFAGVGAVGQTVVTVVMGIRAALWNRSIRSSQLQSDQ